MCDTFSFFSKVDQQRSFFAKNSDRDPGEPQFIEIVDNATENFKTEFLSEKLDKYMLIQFEKLKEIFTKYSHPYAAVISRPGWIWGAEMGVNEKGVAIGNEAVFSKQKLIKNGLLGMDILRLALHNAANAVEASHFIIALLEIYGQGGNGSYSGSLKYHNSFLIKDQKRSIILESTGKSWAKKEFTDFNAISNSYTLSRNYDDASEEIKGKNLKKQFESKFFSYFSKGDVRQAITSKLIQNCDSGLTQTMHALRFHQNGSQQPKRGMKSICVHPGFIVTSETTASMVVDYTANRQIIWHTSSPNPCVSLFKPLIITNNTSHFKQFQSRRQSEEYFSKNREISEFLIRNNNLFQTEIKAIRDKYEDEFREIIYSNIENKTEEQLIEDCLKCYHKESEYLELVRNFMI